MGQKHCKKFQKIIEDNNDLHKAQLKVISLASLQYNQTLRKLRIPYGDANWTTTYEDVCNAIDREILLRERCETLEKALMDSKNIKKEDLDDAVDLLNI